MFTNSDINIKPAIKVALVIGHSAKKQGACNGKVTEFKFNKKLVQDIKKELSNQYEIEADIVYRKTYESLPDDINKLNPDYIVSFHCNAFNGEVSGSETLFCMHSKKGKEMAMIMQAAIVSCLNLPNRGCKPKRVFNRGGHLLVNTKAPCVIVEPFFLDNDSDLKIATKKRDQLVEAIADAISAFVVIE